MGVPAPLIVVAVLNLHNILVYRLNDVTGLSIIIKRMPLIHPILVCYNCL